MRMSQKIYEDFFKKSRLPDYETVLRKFHEAGYKMVGTLDLYNMVSRGELNGKVFYNRHDIDTSPKVARKMFKIEQKVYGKEGSATYYFRDSTIDKKLIAEIDSYGYETGYHYEELATYEKKRKNKDIEKIKDTLPECRKMFLSDLNSFRRNTGSKSLTVASHGDFINTKYGIKNSEILSDAGIREEAGIIVEAYDEIIEQVIHARFADQILLSDFGHTVLNEIEKGTAVIMTLTHPRNWEVDIIENIQDDTNRLLTGLKYRM